MLEIAFIYVKVNKVPIREMRTQLKAKTIVNTLWCNFLADVILNMQNDLAQDYQSQQKQLQFTYFDYR